MWKKHFISEEEAFYNGCPDRTQNIAMELVKDSFTKERRIERIKVQGSNKGEEVMVVQSVDQIVNSEAGDCILVEEVEIKVPIAQIW